MPRRSPVKYISATSRSASSQTCPSRSSVVAKIDESSRRARNATCSIRKTRGEVCQSIFAASGRKNDYRWCGDLGDYNNFEPECCLCIDLTVMINCGNCASRHGCKMKMQKLWDSVGILVLRVGFGCMMLFGHGLGKVSLLGSEELKFPAVLPIGPMGNLLLAIFAEVVCSALLVAGLFTRWAAVPLVITMSVAAFSVHINDPLFMQGAQGPTKEPALLYLIPFTTILITGGGGFSLDAIVMPWFRKKKKD